MPHARGRTAVLLLLTACLGLLTVPGQAMAQKTITLSADSTRVTEGNSGTTDVTLTFTFGEPWPSGGIFIFNISNSGGTATDNSKSGGTSCSDPDPAHADVCYKSGSTLFIPTAGARTANFTFSILGDTTIEPDETYIPKIILGLGTTGWSIANTLTFTIVNDDGVPAQPTGLGATAGNAQVALSWTDPNDATITGWQYRQKAGSGNYGNWITISGAGATTTRHTVTNLNPSTAYAFRIRAVNTNGNSPASAEATATTPIAPGVTVSGSPLTVAEGDPTGGSYTVRLATRPDAAVTVSVAGFAGTTVTAEPAALTFSTSNWNRAQSVTVKAGADADTTDERVTLTHSASGATGYGSALTIDSVMVRVTDTTPTLTLATDPAAVTEGGNISLTLSSDKNVTGTLSVRLTLADRGASGFGAADIQGTLTQTVTTSDFGGGTTGTVSLPTLDDAIVEGTETYRITLNTGSGYVVGGDANADGTVNDNDSAEVTLGSTTLTVIEGQTLTVPVTLSTAVDAVVNGKVTLSGGMPQDDFAAVEASFRIMVGQRRASASFAPQTASSGDGAYNAARSYTATVTLDAPPSGVTVGSDSSDTVRVTDNTPPPTPGVTLSRASLPVNEGASGNYTVRLNTRPSAAVRVTVAGFAGSDVRVDPATLSFALNTWDTAQTVTVTAGADDDGADDSVTLTHSASSGDNDYNAVVISGVMVTVTDSDTPGVSLSATRLALREGGTAGSYTVVLATRPDAEVTVSVAGFAGSDVRPTPATLTFAANAWDTAQTVRVTARQDRDTADDSVTLTHSASGATDYGPALAIDNVAVRVTDDDRPAGVMLSTATLTLAEGTTGRYTVVLDSAPSAMVTVTVAGFAGTDVRADPATLTFATDAWDSMQTVTVTAGQDADSSDDSVTLTHSASGATGYGSALNIADVVLTVTDDDAAAVSEPGAAQRRRQAEQRVLARVADTLLAGSVTILSSRIDAASGGASPASTLRLGGQSSLHAALRALQPALQSGTLRAAPLLGRSAFVLPLSAVAGGSGTALHSLALWGSGDYRQLSGKLQDPDDPATTLDWEGSVTSAWVGADMRPHRQWLTGLALSWSQAPFSTGRTDLDQDSRLFGVHPYLSWNSAAGRGQLWLSAGYGWGELRPGQDTPGARRDSNLASVALGGNATLLGSDRLLPGGSSRLRIKAQGALAEFTADGNATAQALSAIARQLRLALEGQHRHTLAGGALLSPSVELALRHDHSDATEGNGVEVGGALRYSDPALGLTLEGRGWVLATHREAEREEWGVSGLLRLDPGAEQRGLALSLAPRHGPARRMALDHRLDPSVTPTAAPAPGQLGLEAELGYGYGLAAHRGVLVPFVATTLDGTHRAYRFGGRLRLGPGLSLKLEGQRQQAATRAAYHSLLLHGTLHW